MGSEGAIIDARGFPTMQTPHPDGHCEIAFFHKGVWSSSLGFRFPGASWNPGRHGHRLSPV